jgi:hypothetical protein
MMYLCLQVLDRFGLVLTIFSDRAKTRESKLQVSDSIQFCCSLLNDVFLFSGGNGNDQTQQNKAN